MTYLIAKNVSVAFSINASKPKNKNKNKNKNKFSKYFSKTERRPFYPLKNISVELRKGDRVAIVGRNGAGKSTLLRVFSEILPPTEGTVEVSGSLHSIMSISTGLIMSASCSQNIKLKGFSYGLHGDALQDYMEEVKKRSNLDTFLYQPVKSLSAGMRSKLIISMLRGLNPNILIIDEWINVADNRQTDKEHSLAKAIRDTDIFTLATHNRKLITTHCNKCIVLDKGACVHFGEIALGFEILDQLEKTAS